MKTHKTKSVLVRHHEQIGLFTESAFRDIAIAGAPSDAPISEWSTFDLIGIDIDDYVFNALLRMTQFNIQRVIVEPSRQAGGCARANRRAGLFFQPHPLGSAKAGARPNHR